MKCQHDYEVILEKTIILAFDESIHVISEKAFETMVHIAPIDVLSASKCIKCNNVIYGVIPNTIRVSQLKITQPATALKHMEYLLSNYPQYYISVAKELLDKIKIHVQKSTSPNITTLQVISKLQRKIKIAESQV